MNETIVMTGIIKALTPKAVLLKGEGRRPEDRWKQWIPRSVIEDDTDDLSKGDYVDLEVQKWWATQEGLD